MPPLSGKYIRNKYACSLTYLVKHNTYLRCRKCHLYPLSEKYAEGVGGSRTKIHKRSGTHPPSLWRQYLDLTMATIGINFTWNVTLLMCVSSCLGLCNTKNHSCIQLRKPDCFPRCQNASDIPGFTLYMKDMIQLDLKLQMHVIATDCTN